MYYLGFSVAIIGMVLAVLILAINASKKSGSRIHNEMKELLISRNEMLKYQNALFTDIWQVLINNQKPKEVPVSVSELVTVKQMVDIFKCSDTTIKNRIKKHKITPKINSHLGANGRKTPHKYSLSEIKDMFSKDPISNIGGSKVKETESVYDKIEKFVKMVRGYITLHPKYKPVEEAFVSYWTALNEKETKFRREDPKYKYFDIGKRLGTFLQNYNIYNGNKESK